MSQANIKNIRFSEIQPAQIADWENLAEITKDHLSNINCAMDFLSRAIPDIEPEHLALAKLVQLIVDHISFVHEEMHRNMRILKGESA